MKKRLRLAVVGVVVLLLGGIGWLIGRSLRAQWRQEITQTGLDLLPQVAQRIQDFHRVRTLDGRKVWEVAAREAQYFDEEHQVVVKEPLLRLFLKDGRAVGLSGDEGRVLLAGRELDQVEMRGNIEVQFADYTAHAEQAVYRRSDGLISSTEPVEIVGRALELHAERMEVDVDAQTLRLFRRVTMTLQPDSHPDLPSVEDVSHVGHTTAP
ncbi:MAG TPA: LPS export ABC transporter periplasmic protein LptC [Candidatus Kryptonia bacterium]|nr:LPS export ABC transporter periplasmic protein LptC [Candidatus Kryptonia bacterium]